VANISVCLGIELFNSSVGFQRDVADVGGWVIKLSKTKLSKC
jgi:hypothetical protein